MKIEIDLPRASTIFWEGKYYDKGQIIDVPFSEAFRLSRVAQVKTSYDRVAYDPALFKEQRFFNFFGDVDLNSGFGNCSYYLMKHSVDKFQVALAGKTFDVRDRDLLQARLRDLNQAGAMVWHDQPKDIWVNSPFQKNIAIVPFETTRVPPSWVGRLNTFDALLVPCEQNIQAFRDSGVRIPIDLIHWGVDPLKFYPLEREDSDVFTFGTMGALSLRKGTDLLIDAFIAAFPRERDVRLICKTSYTHYPFMVKDKRIEVQMSPVGHDELLSDFFKRAQCFVFPTRGEGFGLTPLEALATGIPAIATNWGGIREYLRPEYGWLLDYEMVPAKNFSEFVYKEDCGDWAEPNKDQLVDLMRYAYTHQNEVREKGRRAAEYVKSEWTWAKKIGMYHTALEKYL